MGNLRSMIDGVGNLTLGITPDKVSNDFKVQEDVILRRRTNRSGPITNEVMVGKILAMNGDEATISIMKAGGIKEQKVCNIRDLSHVTASERRSSIQFSPQYRARV